MAIAESIGFWCKDSTYFLYKQTKCHFLTKKSGICVLLYFWGGGGSWYWGYIYCRGYSCDSFYRYHRWSPLILN